MVYAKEDGSYGFSWKKQYDYLLREHPENLEDIVHFQLEIFKEQQPEKANYYEDLNAELRQRIGEAWDKNPDFGYKDSDDVVKAFVKEKELGDLFDDVPASEEIEDVELDLDLEDEEIAPWLTEI